MPEPDVVTSRHYKLRLSREEDEAWSEEGAQSLIGQRVAMNGFPEGGHGRVIAAEVLDDGALEATIKVSKDPL